MNWIPRCKHGPFCTGGPLHIPLIPANVIERLIARVWPPPQFNGWCFECGASLRGVVCLRCNPVEAKADAM